MPQVPQRQGPSVEASALPLPTVGQEIPIEAFGGGRAASAGGYAATSALNQDVQAWALAERQKAQKARLTDEETILNDWEHANLHDPKTGALWRLGQNAIGASDAALKDYERLVKERSKGITNPDLRAAYDQMAEGRRRQITGRLTHHEGRQSAVIQEQTDEANILSWKQMGGADPVQSGEALNKIAGAVSRQAKRHGWTPEITSQQLKAHESDLHAVSIQTLVDRGEWDRAEKYFNAVQDRITPQASGRIRSLIEKGQAQAEASRIVEGIFQKALVPTKIEKGKPVEWSVEELPSISTLYGEVQEATKGASPETKQLAKEMAKRRYSELEEARNAQQEATYDGILTTLSSGRPLKPSQQADLEALPFKMRNNIEKMQSKDHDPEVWKAFEVIYVSNPDRLAKLKPSEFDSWRVQFGPWYREQAEAYYKDAKANETKRVNDRKGLHDAATNAIMTLRADKSKRQTLSREESLMVADLVRRTEADYVKMADKGSVNEAELRTLVMTELDKKVQQGGSFLNFLPDFIHTPVYKDAPLKDVLKSGGKIPRLSYSSIPGPERSSVETAVKAASGLKLTGKEPEFAAYVEDLYHAHQKGDDAEMEYILRKIRQGGK